MIKKRSILIFMEWSNIHQKWLMKDSKEKVFVNDFWDCFTIKKMFAGLDKNKPTKYLITIEKR